MMFLRERIIIGIVWLICFVSIWFIPKAKYRNASVIFLITQLFAWILGILAVELGLIEYPVRELEKANATFFSFEYFVLPFMCIFFNLYYPQKKSLWSKLAFYLMILAPFTFIETLVEKHTRLLHYIHWEWYYTFFSMWLVFYLVRAIYKWFYNIERPLSL
jgi:hypothetical protein